MTSTGENVQQQQSSLTFNKQKLDNCQYHLFEYE